MRQAAIEIETFLAGGAGVSAAPFRWQKRWSKNGTSKQNEPKENSCRRQVRFGPCCEVGLPTAPPHILLATAEVIGDFANPRE
jgi:hypothetical protein